MSPRVTPIDEIGEVLERTLQHASPEAHLMIVLVEPMQEKVAMIITSDNITHLTNAGVGLLELAAEAEGNCPCETCAMAMKKVKKALRYWPRSNVLPFQRPS